MSALSNPNPYTAGADSNNATGVNVVYTHAGSLRSGDLHPCEQVNHIVWGRCGIFPHEGVLALVCPV